MRAATALTLVLVMTFGVRAQEFCSLTVEVVSPNEYPLSGVSVAIEEAGRREIELTKSGIIQFCGLGLSSVTITVGANSRWCQNVVRDVPLTWSVPAKIKVIYDSGPCRVANSDQGYGVLDKNTPSHCSALLSFVDERGNSVPGVKLRPLNGSADPRSDAFGRFMVGLTSDSPLHLMSQKDGFASEKIDLSCPYEAFREERFVTLRKSR